MGVSVIGAGAWGTAIAKLLAEKGEAVTLWCREEDVYASIRDRHVNETFLPDQSLPASLATTRKLASIEDSDLIVIAVPSQFFRSVAVELRPFSRPDQRLVSATKGIEEGTLLRMSEVLADVLPFDPDVTAISGPTFAKEVARGEPTGVVAASAREGSAEAVQERLATKNFRVYTNDDIIGVELGGAMKNVTALVIGVAVGLGLGHNPRAGLMARGLREIERLAEAMGGRRDTIAGLAGMGDLVLTCTGELSRNRTVGVAIGRGEQLEDILSAMPQVAEGVSATHAAVALAKKYDVEMPLAYHMEKLLVGEINARQAMDALLSRPLRAE